MDTYSAVMQVVGGNLKRIRKSQKKTITKLANEVHMSATTISEIETGKRNPSIFTLCLIADALGVPFQDLLADKKGRG
jgi:transcriptional regulator with XRE-family HTH domain